MRSGLVVGLVGLVGLVGFTVFHSQQVLARVHSPRDLSQPAQQLVEQLPVGHMVAAEQALPLAQSDGMTESLATVHLRKASHDATVSRLAEVMRQVAQSLLPFQKQYRLARLRARGKGQYCLGAELKGSFIPGCPSIGCRASPTKEAAHASCAAQPDCSGVVHTRGAYEMRSHSRVQPSPDGESAWMLEPCEPSKLSEAAGLAAGQTWQPATPIGIYDAFVQATNRTLAQRALRLQEKVGQPRREPGPVRGPWADERLRTAVSTRPPLLVLSAHAGLATLPDQPAPAPLA